MALIGYATTVLLRASREMQRHRRRAPSLSKSGPGSASLKFIFLDRAEEAIAEKTLLDKVVVWPGGGVACGEAQLSCHCSAIWKSTELLAVEAQP